MTNLRVQHSPARNSGPCHWPWGSRFKQLLLALAITPGAAQAHDVWLGTADHSGIATNEVAIGLFIGEHGQPPEAFAFDPARVERLWLTSTLGVQEIDVTGPLVKMETGAKGPGTRSLTYISTPAKSILPADNFDEYLREEHLDHIIMRRNEAEDSSSMVSELYSRSLKLLLTDTDESLVDCPVGLPLELSIVSADESEIVVQASFQGQALSGAWIDRAEADGTVVTEAETNSNGRVALSRRNGDWVLRTTHMEADSAGDADWRSWWATTSFRLTEAGVGACSGRMDVTQR